MPKASLNSPKQKDLLLVAGVVAGFVGVAVVVKYGLKGSSGFGGQTYSVVFAVESNGVPVPYASIQFGTASQVTDQNGSATFDGFLANTYPVIVTAAGFQTLNETVSVSSSQTSFSISLEPNTTCAPQTCDCTAVWDTALCQCSVLIPSAVVVPISQTQYMEWTVQVKCLSKSACAVASPGVKTCPAPPYGNPAGWPNPCAGQSTQYGFNLTGSVQDSAGRPICNQTVDISLSQTTMQWQAEDGMTGGTFTIQAPGSVVTDSTGTFTHGVIVTIAVRSWQVTGCIPNPLCAIGLCSNPGYQNMPLTVTYKIPGTQIGNASILSMQMLICDYFCDLC